MKIAQEEIFGPVMSVIKFKTEEEAIKRANATSYGLAAGVCTKDVGRALRVANSIRAGTVWVNNYSLSPMPCTSCAHAWQQTRSTPQPPSEV